MEKVITLESISLRNFKGITNKKFEFTRRESSILGANGTGKSSLFAAFVWVLFGKDQFGRTNHEIKTLVDGKSDRDKECEVEIILNINGKQKTLRRAYSEKWTRAKGAAEDEFKGNTTAYYVDDVNVKESEYIIEVSNICSEDVFRSITNPSYFPNLKPEEQRTILFRLIGDISNEQIAENSHALQEFLQMVTGKSFEAFKKEIADKKRRLADDVKDIPARIDELKRTIPEPMNWEEIEAKAAGVNNEIDKITGQLEDQSKLSKEQNDNRLAIQEQINNLKQENQKIGFSAKDKRNKDVESRKEEIRRLRLEEGSFNQDYNRKSARLQYLIKEKERLTNKLSDLGRQWKEINAEQLTFKDNEFLCPTCGAPFNASKIEEMQNTLLENFNQRKSEHLILNEKEGKATKEELDKINTEIKEIGELNKVDTSNITKQIEEKESALHIFESQTLDYENTPEYKTNIEKIEELQKQLDQPANTMDNTDLLSRKTSLNQAYQEYAGMLAKKSIIQNTQDRIRQLENERDDKNQQIADLERKEFLQKSFEYTKNKKYETEINRLFRFIKFKLFKKQVDGQIIPTCVLGIRHCCSPAFVFLPQISGKRGGRRGR